VLGGRGGVWTKATPQARRQSGKRSKRGDCLLLTGPSADPEGGGVLKNRKKHLRGKKGKRATGLTALEKA